MLRLLPCTVDVGSGSSSPVVRILTGGSLSSDSFRDPLPRCTAESGHKLPDTPALQSKIRSVRLLRRRSLPRLSVGTLVTLLPCR